MTDLVEFLRARLDEDADDANTLAIHRADCAWFPVGDGCSYPCDCEVPERLLREVESKRQIVNYEADGHLRGLHIDAWGIWRDQLKLLALPDADHPDYQQEWRLSAPS